MCSLNESLLSNIIPRYFTLFTWSKGVLLRYISISFCSFRFRLVRSITFDFCSLNLILLSFAHAEILLNSTYVCIYVCAYICMYVCILYVCMYICICVCMYVYICVCGCMNKCVYVCLCYAKVRERVELCFYSTPGPSWPVIGWNWLLTSCMLFCVFCMYVCMHFLFT